MFRPDVGLFDMNLWENPGFFTHFYVIVRFSVNVRQEMLEEAQTKLMDLLNSTEGKIDKYVFTKSIYDFQLLFLKP